MNPYKISSNAWLAFALFSFHLCNLQAAPQAATTDAANVMPTVAEHSGYTATASGKQVEAFLRQLAGQWPESELSALGRTVEGRPLWGLIIDPQVNTDAKPVTVLMLGGIHAGECAGKEALLSLARDMAAARQDPWWGALRLIFIPNFNADGNERRGKLHRPGQVGPIDGMGIRENAQGLDLNRDFIKLESPEVRSLVAALNEFDVDIVIDLHTTNGSLHGYDLTYDIPHHPTTPAAIDRWLRGELLPGVTEKLSAKGHETFYYGNFDREHRRWTTYGHEPRYSTEYMGLRGRIGILVEAYAYASYETRIRASYAFVDQILRAVAENAETVRQLVADETLAPGTAIPIQAKLGKTADGIDVQGFQQSNGSPPMPPYSADFAAGLEARTYSTQIWNRGIPVRKVTLPWGYVIPEQYAWAVSRLIRHGVQVKRLELSVSAQSEAYEISSVQKSSSFQRHELLTVEVEAKEAVTEFARGSYVVETDQPLGVLATYLLEPAADDSLAKWNFFDPDMIEGHDYPVLRLPSALPREATQAIQSVGATEKITLDRLLQPERAVDYDGPGGGSASWLAGSSDYIVQRANRYVAVDASSGAQRPLQEIDVLREQLAALDAFSEQDARSAARPSALSEDRTAALIAHAGDLFWVGVQSQAARQLTHSPTEVEQLAEMSPTGSHVAFIRDNNLWVVDCESTELKQLTDDGTPEILNGILDWVYQEELYGRGKFKAFWWSPDGQKIAYLQLDESPVPHYQVSDSISFGQALEDTRYPKAGEPLPTVRVWVVDIASGSRIECNLDSFPADDRLVVRVTWSPTSDLWLQVLNRVQNRQDVVRVDVPTGSCTSLFSEVSPGWIEIRGTPEFLPNGDFLWLSDLPDGRTHLFSVSVESGQQLQLTSGPWDVASLLSVASDGKTAFVSGNISHPTESQLVAVDLDAGTFQQVTSAPGTHRVSVDSAGEYFIDVFSNTEAPPYTSLHSSDGQLIRVLDAPVSDRHEFLSIRPPKQLTIPARDGFELQASVMLPLSIDEENPLRRLPVLFYVYAGPQAPTVKNAWGGRNYWWHQMLCQQGFAVVMCDNRASLGRGVKDTWAIRGQMGTVELQDLEDAVAWVTQQAWADSERLGIWGWSYGGYFTSYAMTHSQLFKAGIAGVPVTDWRNYDAIYTERYMDLPQVNPQGYESSSSVQAAADLHGRLLILHGERDDNVHISNSLQLAHALQAAGRQFDMMVYPKNRHGIVNAKQRHHMYQLMTDFLHEHLMGR